MKIVFISKLLAQLCIITLFLGIGNLLHTYVHIPLPGSIIGLLLLFTVLKAKILPLKFVDVGASFLTGELLLFFVPAAVGIIQYNQIFGMIGLKIIIVILLSSFIVMMITGLIAEKFAKGDDVK